MNSFFGVVIILGHVIGVSYATECPSSTLNISVNSTIIPFSSPGFPADYARPLSCTWLFTAGDNEVINFRIRTFDVFPSIFCYRDIFVILDGKLKYSAVLQAWCGGRPAGQKFQTSTQHSMVTFQAVTQGGSRQGFELEVWSEVKYEPEMGR